MDAHWKGSVEIHAPADRVFTYLADFPKHCEWAQTLERMEMKRAGNEAGVGAIYRTFEKQAMQADRQPRGPMPTKAFKGTTECQVTVLVPGKRIAWRAHPVPMGMGVHAELEFDLTPIDANRTRLTQAIDMHEPWLAFQIFTRFVFKTNPAGMEQMARAQWQASLDNIKAILEESSGREGLAAD